MRSRATCVASFLWLPLSCKAIFTRYLHVYEHGTMSFSCCPREVAFSLLSVAVEGLAGRVQFSCTAVLMGEAEVDTVSVTAYCECV